MGQYRQFFTRLVLVTGVLSAGSAVAQENPTVANLTDQLRGAVERAIAEGDPKLAEEGDRVPGLTYDDISRVSRLIPGNVQIPDPTSGSYSSRAISVPGGLVTEECRHFVRGALVRRMMETNPNLTREGATEKISGHLEQQRERYARVAGERGLLRSEVAVHDADCPICGPLNAAEIQCHKSVVRQSPIRELVMFDFASDRLRPDYFGTVGFIKQKLDSDPGLKVALIGRASIPGGPVPNFTLSAKRIASVWNGLVDAGVPAERIVAIPIGEDEPHIDLQLAIEYGLEGDFATFGQNPLNQSVYMAVFRGDDAVMTVDVSAPTREEIDALNHHGHAHSDGEASATLQRPLQNGRVAEPQSAQRTGGAADPASRPLTVAEIMALKRFSNYVRTKMGRPDATDEEIMDLFAQFKSWQGQENQVSQRR